MAERAATVLGRHPGLQRGGGHRAAWWRAVQGPRRPGARCWWWTTAPPTAPPSARRRRARAWCATPTTRATAPRSRPASARPRARSSCCMDADGQHDPAEARDGCVAPIGVLRHGDRRPRRGGPVAWCARSATRSSRASPPGSPGGPSPTSPRASARRAASALLEILHLLPNGFSYPTTSCLAFLKAGHNVPFVPITRAAAGGHEQDPVAARRRPLPAHHLQDRHPLQPAAGVLPHRRGLVRCSASPTASGTCARDGKIPMGAGAADPAGGRGLPVRAHLRADRRRAGRGGDACGGSGSGARGCSPLLLALLPPLAYAPAWGEGRLLGPGDGAALHFPLRAAVWHAYRARRAAVLEPVDLPAARRCSPPTGRAPSIRR